MPGCDLLSFFVSGLAVEFFHLFIIILILLLHLYSPLSFHSSLPCFTLHSCFTIMDHSFIVHAVFSNFHLYSEYYKGFSKLQMLYSLMSICWFSHCVFCISVIMFCLWEPHFSWSFFFFIAFCTYLLMKHSFTYREYELVIKSVLPKNRLHKLLSFGLTFEL